jgi:non-canonical purine NTP pyrophosphatase (RdgB/HAM1 family)
MFDDYNEGPFMNSKNNSKNYNNKNTILFITGNQGKVDEINTVINDYPDFKQKYEIKNVNIDLPEIQSVKSMEVLEHKLLTAYNRINKEGGKYQLNKMNIDTSQNIPVMVEDTSLSFENFNDFSFPGPLIKYYLNSIGLDSMCVFHYGKKALGTVMIGYYDGVTMKYFEGSVMGIVPIKPRGNNGFGWDKIFIPLDNNENNLTFAEMDSETKKQYSMRAIATHKFIQSFT